MQKMCSDGVYFSGPVWHPEIVKNSSVMNRHSSVCVLCRRSCDSFTWWHNLCLQWIQEGRKALMIHFRFVMVPLYKPLQSAVKFSPHLFSYLLESPCDFKPYILAPTLLRPFIYTCNLCSCWLEHDPIQGAPKSRSNNKFYLLHHHSM